MVQLEDLGKADEGKRVFDVVRDYRLVPTFIPEKEEGSIPETRGWSLEACNSTEK